jgi:exopolysaccharide biosynthesis polyprenyl glycosylphosphotransferase
VTPIQANETLAYPGAEPTALEPPGSPVARVAGRPRLDLRWLALRQAVLAGAMLVTTVVTVRAGRGSSVPWILCFCAYAVLFASLPKPSPRRLRLDVFDEVRDVVLTTALAAIALMATMVVFSSDPSVASDALRIWATTTVLLVPGRLAVSKLEVRRRAAGAAQRALIIGAGRVGQLTAKRLQQQPELGLRPVGFLDKAPMALNGASANLPVLGASWDLEEVVRRHGITHAIFTFSSAPHDVLLRMISRCVELGVSVSLVPRLFEKIPTRLSIDHVGGLPLISIFPSDPMGWQVRLKYSLDRVLAAALLIVLSPLLAAAALAVLASLGSPVLYRQRRVGRDGQEFELLKFRSMHGTHDDEPTPILPPDTAPGGVETSDRRTPVGKLLRRTSIDEFPQLINVLRGQMTLVGPRPERPEFAARFERHVHRYSERGRVKSGITGWAQVCGLRGQTSLSDRVEWDNYYIENWSFWLDLKILMLTLRAVLRFAGE